MAIFMRRGSFEDFVPGKMLPGEWAIVLANDPSVPDGKSVYICFSAGNVKRMATYEDMVEQFGDMADDIVNQLKADVNAVIILANDAAEYANREGNRASEQALAAENAANKATNVATDLESRRDAGEFKGDKGDKGDKGEQGASGIMAATAGMFSLYVYPEIGDLYVEYPDGTEPPRFEYEEGEGNLYFITG